MSPAPDASGTHRRSPQPGDGGWIGLSEQDEHPPGVPEKNGPDGARTILFQTLGHAGKYRHQDVDVRYPGGGDFVFRNPLAKTREGGQRPP